MKKVLSIFLSLFMLWACSDKEDPSQPIQPILPDDDNPVEVEDSVFYQLNVDDYELVAVSQSGTCMLMQTDTTFAFSCLFDSCGTKQLIAYCDSAGVVERIVIDNQVINILYHEDKQKMDIFYKKEDNTIGWIEDVESPYSKLPSRVEAGDVPYSAISVMNNLSYAVYTVINTYDVLLPIKAWGLVQKYSKAPIPIGDAVQMIQHLLGKDYKQLMLKHYMAINQVMADYAAWVKEELYGDAIPLLQNYATRKAINDLTLTACVEGVDSLKNQFKIGVIATDDEHVTLDTYTYLYNMGLPYNPKQINYACTFPMLETGKRYKFRPYLAPVSSSKYLKGAKCMLDYYKYGSIQDHLLLETKAEVLSNTDEEVKFKLSVAYAKTSVKMGMIYGEHPDLLNHEYKQVEYQPTFSESLMSYDYEEEVKLENMKSGCIYYMPYIIYNDYVVNRTLYPSTTTPIVSVITKEDYTFYGKIDSIHVINNPITGDAEADGNTLTLNGSFDKNITNMVEESGMGVQKETSSSRAGGQEDITIENSTVIKADVQEDGTFKATLDLNEEDSCVYYRAYIKVKGKVYYGEVKKFTKEKEEDPLREALIKLYNSTGGDNWTRNNGWCSDKPVDKWYGVYLDPERNKYYLYLDKNNLTGEINQILPNSIGKLYVTENQLTSINVSGSTDLITLFCNHNQLTSIDVSDCNSLISLYCEYNQLSSLNASNCKSFSYLYCSQNQLSSVNVSNCTDLTYMDCWNNKLESLTLSDCTALTYLRCNNNLLASLDMSNSKALTEIICYENQLSSLNVYDCNALTNLDCRANQLTSLDITKCMALTHLDCSINQLTSLDVSNCATLNSLCCNNNKLSSLDISNCMDLIYLNCNENQLTTLDVSKCTKVTDVHCQKNQLTSLNLSGCIELEWLDCWVNQLTSLDIPKNEKMYGLICNSNKINQEIPDWFSQFSKFIYDKKYHYWDEEVDGEMKRMYHDYGTGWWYPGEPEKGYHGK